MLASAGTTQPIENIVHEERGTSGTETVKIDILNIGPDRTPAIGSAGGHSVRVGEARWCKIGQVPVAAGTFENPLSAVCFDDFGPSSDQCNGNFVVLCLVGKLVGASGFLQPLWWCQ